MSWIQSLFQSPVFQTIIAGVFVFIISQYILRFAIEPLQEYKRVIAIIDNKLKFYSNVIVNPPFEGQPLSKDHFAAKRYLRELSCELEASYKVLPFKKHRSDKESVSKAAVGLIWLSNTTGRRDKTGTVNVPLLASDKIREVRSNLKIPEL